MPAERSPIVMVLEDPSGEHRSYNLFDRSPQRITLIEEIFFVTSKESVREYSELLGTFASELVQRLFELGATQVGVRNDKIVVSSAKDSPCWEAIEQSAFESLGSLYSNHGMAPRLVKKIARV